MKRALFHAAFLAVALALTLVVFNFWGNFGRALYNYLDMATAPAKPSGVVTMKIVPPAPPPANRPACDSQKQHCP